MNGDPAATCSEIAATVGGESVTVVEVDAREQILRERFSTHALPRPGTGEARQLRRWITQVLVAERVVAAEARALPFHHDIAPSEMELLPDEVARLEIGSVAASTLSESVGRAVFACVTAEVRITDDDARSYHNRNPFRFSKPRVFSGGERDELQRTSTGADFDEVRPVVIAHLLAAAQRREYRRWLDTRCADVVTLAQGYEHPGDPRQPDHAHRH